MNLSLIKIILAAMLISVAYYLPDYFDLIIRLIYSLYSLKGTSTADITIGAL